MTTRVLVPVAGSLARGLGLTVFAALSTLIVVNSLPYFTSASDVPFLLEKGARAHDPLWRVSFHLHVAGGLLCLAAVLLPLSRTVLRRWPGVHRLSGRVYGMSALLLVVPPGLVLAVHAKGGAWGAWGFALVGLWMGLTTALGIRAAVGKRWRDHRVWMTRSFAMAATAPSFRVVYLALAWGGVRGEYVLAIWLSGFLNLAAGEWFVDRIRQGA